MVPITTILFSPNPQSSAMVQCLHCGKRYEERKISWEERNGEWLWWCPSKDCDGRGLEFDIFPTGEHADELQSTAAGDA